jgi:hypothetical protein
MPALQRWIGSRSIEALAAFCLERIDSLYMELDSQTGGGRARYFAEKFRPDDIAALVWDLYPRVREVILVRDLRDVVCSIFASSAKRGVQELPRDRECYIVDAVKRRVAGTRQAWLERSDRAHLVRYEDLVRDADRVLAERACRQVERRREPQRQNSARPRPTVRVATALREGGDHLAGEAPAKGAGIQPLEALVHPRREHHDAAVHHPPHPG